MQLAIDGDTELSGRGTGTLTPQFYGTAGGVVPYNGITGPDLKVAAKPTFENVDNTIQGGGLLAAAISARPIFI